MKLTDLDIKAFKPGEKLKRVLDGNGLLLEIPTTGKKHWRFRYSFQGKENMLSLGTYPEVSLKEARIRRNDAKKLLHEGHDPAKVKQLSKQAGHDLEANSFEAVSIEWRNKKRTVWDDGTSDTIKRRLDNWIIPHIGKMHIAEIAPLDVLKVVRYLEASNKIESAHRALGYIGQIFRYAVASGRIPSDPSRDLRGALPPKKVTHRAAVTDPDSVEWLIKWIYAYDGSEIVKHALRLAPLVFVRPGELRKAEWKDIDLKEAEWRYHVSKTKTDHIVPLSRQAVAILENIQKWTHKSRYVFPSPRTNDRPMSENAILAAMRRSEIMGDTMTGHGFRAMARTLLDEVLGFPPHIIEHQLAHVVRDPLGRAYNRTKHLKERREMMQKWADYLDELKNKPDEK